MKNSVKKQPLLPRLFSDQNAGEVDYQQISSFFYDQLIDAFVFFTADKPVDWSTISPAEKQLKILSDNFRINDVNDAFTLQVDKDARLLRGTTLGDFFGKAFDQQAETWYTLIRKGEVFAEFSLHKKRNVPLWVEANYRFIRNIQGKTVGIIVVQRDISQRKLIFRVNEEIEERLHRLTKLSFQAIAIVRKGVVFDTNEAMVKLTGYSQEEILHSRILASCFKRTVSRVLFGRSTTPSSGTFETRLYRKDSSVITVEVETQATTYNNEQVCLIGIQDITNRKRIEDEIVKLSVALDQSANEIIITHKNGEIEYVNRSFTRVTGYLPSEVIGRNPRVLKSGMHPPSFYKDLWKTLAKGQQWAGEFQNRKKNGELYWESATITPIRNKNGEIVRYIAIKEDITLRKKAEQSLRESEEKFRSMVSNIPGVVYRCAFDRDWTVMFITDAIENLAGYKAADLQGVTGRTLTSFIHPGDVEKVKESIRKGVESFKHYNLEYRILTRNNTIKWVSNSGRPVYDDTGTVKWLDGFLLDITDRISVFDELKKAKIAAEEANNAKSEFLANISHEIRTPLNSVLGFTELLEGLTSDSVQIKYLNSIRASGKNLMMLINDLLDLSKIESGKMTIHYAFFDIRRLLDEIRNVFSLRVNIKGIGYVEKVDDHFPAEIKFDEIRLRQILINLVGNAVKFTHQGEIRIVVRAMAMKTQQEKPTIKLEIKVKDTGIGIPENSFKLIFESFRQHSQLDSRKYEGTGLGLAITKRLVEAMEGQISLQSQVGKGSTFKVVFPNVEYSKTSTNTFSTVSDDVAGNETEGAFIGMANNAISGEEILDGQVDLGAIKNADLSLLLRRFENELAVRWKLFEKKQPLREIQSFAQEIVTLGRSFKIGFLVHYGEQLLSTIENFDIEEMRLQLDYFPDLLKQLKKLADESK